MHLEFWEVRAGDNAYSVIFCRELKQKNRVTKMQLSPTVLDGGCFSGVFFASVLSLLFTCSKGSSPLPHYLLYIVILGFINLLAGSYLLRFIPTLLLSFPMFS